jgi:hypothetical protein
MLRLCDCDRGTSFLPLSHAAANCGGAPRTEGHRPATVVGTTSKAKQMRKQKLRRQLTDRAHKHLHRLPALPLGAECAAGSQPAPTRGSPCCGGRAGGEPGASGNQIPN